MTRTVAISTITVLLLAAPLARAEPVPDAALAVDAAPAAYSFGARVGGFGFRNTDDPETGAWDDCRMNGVGLFAQRSLGHYLFAEAAFDLYTAKDAVATADGPPEMDRISGVTSVAGGARIPWRWVAPYIQLGAGVEVTRARMAAVGMEDRAVAPMGFLGIGADLRISPRLSLGAALRHNLIRHYRHDASVALGATGGTGEMTADYEDAAQGQIILRYEM
jgi:hypothetical protein